MVKKKIKIAVYPGTFDPITYGHIDIIERASKVFDKLIIAVGDNPHKNPVFSLEERVVLLKKVLREENLDESIEVDWFQGLLINYLKRKKANVIIRGLRVFTDFEYEMAIAAMNKKMAPEIETVLFMTSEKYSFISSSLIKEVAKFGGCIKGYAPESVINALVKKLKS